MSQFRDFRRTSALTCSIAAALILFVLLFFQPATATTLASAKWASLQADTSHLFWHGFDGYMKYAFPEDELRALTCGAFTRDFEDQNRWEVNDPLPDYSLTLIDSLSTLAILASSSQSSKERKRAFNQFQSGVESLVKLYGDGSSGSKGKGSRARGFDIDSKVQVFETAIRGLGGLLSAHLFAVGELPIHDYDPIKLQSKQRSNANGIKWTHRFTYDGQLLRLAHDLGQRLLPAFETQTGIPYPRVNLRHGIPFYRNAPRNCETDPPDDDFGDNMQCPATPQAQDERTETCSAGAGSLVLEFTVLSRLIGDDRFEQQAKRAFWAVWRRRMPTGLVGAGIDAETGEWKGSPTTGIGAGIDSFYEYAAKSYILLSGSAKQSPSDHNSTFRSQFEPSPLSDLEESSEGFLVAWQQAQKAIRRHVYNEDNVVHPFYMQVNLWNAAQSATWIDSLSAFYPGTLTLTGHVDEAEITHLLYTAIWARYSAIPERWSTTSGEIEHGLPWWPGRPEFIESAWYLYRATQDPWYVHVGEMALRDIKRRCWTRCGWAGLQDVRTGELTDRMESFFLGETAKYLHLLFDPGHPLNKLDAPWVFTTEGHPLIIPRKNRGTVVRSKKSRRTSTTPAPSCPAARAPLPLTFSNTAARSDLFHAAALARLHLSTAAEQANSELSASADGRPSISLEDVRSPTNNSFYPWTLPQELVPPKGTCAPIPQTPTIQITFPSPSSLVVNAPNQRTVKGIYMNTLAGVKLSLVQDVSDERRVVDAFRVNAINSQPIGRDEQVFISRDTISGVTAGDDPNFSRIRDPAGLEIVFDVPRPAPTPAPTGPVNDSAAVYSNIMTQMEAKLGEMDPEREHALMEQLVSYGFNEAPLSTAFQFLMDKISSRLSGASQSAAPAEPVHMRHYINAVTASGAGAAPLPNIREAPSQDLATGASSGDLLWPNLFLGGELCDAPLAMDIVRTHQVIVLQRGGCSFSDKLENIPAFPPGRTSLQLVVVVNYSDGRHVGDHDTSGLSQDQLDRGDFLFRPLLDRAQVTRGGVARRNPIPVVMVGGGEETYALLSEARSLGVKRHYSIHAQGMPVRNVHVV